MLFRLLMVTNHKQWRRRVCAGWENQALWVLTPSPLVLGDAPSVAGPSSLGAPGVYRPGVPPVSGADMRFLRLPWRTLILFLILRWRTTFSMPLLRLLLTWWWLPLAAVKSERDELAERVWFLEEE
uniref:Uncharacterized protein n=1 Tax=Lactuca sativa TaxID=4236 RepID=A0A9R1W337_LACSA|nr:hypothetical protein LSAT_V11C300122910 [Lactuca sativa]